MEEKKILESTNEIEVLQVCELLKENNIPYIRKDEGAGGYIKQVVGRSFGFKCIYVSNEDFEKARQVIENFTKKSENNDEYIEEEIENSEEADEEIQKDLDKYKKVIRIMFGWIPLAMVLIILVTGFVLSLILEK